MNQLFRMDICRYLLTAGLWLVELLVVHRFKPITEGLLKKLFCKLVSHWWFGTHTSGFKQPVTGVLGLTSFWVSYGQRFFSKFRGKCGHANLNHNFTLLLIICLWGGGYDGRPHYSRGPRGMRPSTLALSRGGDATRTRFTSDPQMMSLNGFAACAKPLAAGPAHPSDPQHFYHPAKCEGFRPGYPLILPIPFCKLRVTWNYAYSLLIKNYSLNISTDLQHP